MAHYRCCSCIMPHNFIDLLFVHYDGIFCNFFGELCFLKYQYVGRRCGPGPPPKKGHDFRKLVKIVFC